MTLQRLHYNFLIYEENLIFFFIRAQYTVLTSYGVFKYTLYMLVNICTYSQHFLRKGFKFTGCEAPSPPHTSIIPKPLSSLRQVWELRFLQADHHLVCWVNLCHVYTQISLHFNRGLSLSLNSLLLKPPILKTLAVNNLLSSLIGPASSLLAFYLTQLSSL